MLDSLEVMGEKRAASALIVNESPSHFSYLASSQLRTTSLSSSSPHRLHQRLQSCIPVC